MRNLLIGLAMPPTGFVLMIALGLLLRLRFPRAGIGIAVLGLAAVLLSGMPAVTYSLLLALETNLPTTPPLDNPPQAIIVLSAEIVRAPDEPFGVRPGLLTLDRLRTGAALARRTNLPILVSGGLAHPDLPPIATVMRDSLRDDFRLETRWVEDRSRDTWENAAFSTEILKQAGITSVYLVTSAWHMRRSLLSFRDTGLTVTAAPTPLDAPMGPEPGDFVPRAGGWQTGYYAAHEWIGYAWYALRH